MTSLLDRLQNDVTLGPNTEIARQTAEDDSAFVSLALYYLELQLADSNQTYLFPFAMPPQNVSMSESFAVEATPTQGSGLYFEENGIVMRRISMQGTTGFAPRPLQGSAPASRNAPNSAQVKYDWVRTLPATVKHAISGQRHLQYLQDNVLRTYSAYKKNPALAPDTKLYWHSVRDDEHWLVAPESFELTQAAASPFVYRYNLSFIVKKDDQGLHVVGTVSPDKNILQLAADQAKSLQNAVDRGNAALQDLTKLTGDIRNVVQDDAKVVVAAGNIFNNVGRFIQGVTTAIDSPFAIVLAAADAIDNLLAIEYDLKNLGKFGGYPAVVRDRFLNIMQSYDQAMLQPTAFVTSAQQRLNDFYAAQADNGSNNVVATAPTTLRAMEGLGTGNLPGQATINRVNLNFASANQPKYTGTHAYTVQQNDTLIAIATTQMGDASLWSFLAEFNRLKPPFSGALPAAKYTGVTDDMPPTGVLTVGQVLLVPDYSTPPAQLPGLPVLGVRPSESSDVHLFGRDLLLDYGGSNTRNAPDLVIDTAHGSMDFCTVDGLDNLAQAIQTQVYVEAGTDVLYPGLGMQPIIGIGVTAIDVQATVLRVRQAIASDSRVQSIRSVTLDNLNYLGNSQGDLLNIAAVIVPVGASAPTRLTLSV